MDNDTTIKLIENTVCVTGVSLNLSVTLRVNILHEKEAIYAYCYDCQGYCEDGKAECDQTQCPLYTYSQFNKYNINKREKE